MNHIMTQKLRRPGRPMQKRFWPIEIKWTQQLRAKVYFTILRVDFNLATIIFYPSLRASTTRIFPGCSIWIKQVYSGIRTSLDFPDTSHKRENRGKKTGVEKSG